MGYLVHINDVVSVLEECGMDEKLFEKDVYEKMRAIPGVQGGFTTNGWHTGNPSEPSKYYVTLAIRHEGTDIRWTELKKYGKNGWDMPEDGAIQVIAWMPAPEVYRG